MLNKILKFIKKLLSSKDQIEELLAPKKEETEIFPSFNWAFGAFNGSQAREAPNATITNLKVSTKGLSYSWASGGCEQLGADTRTDPSATLACLFCKIDGQWIGGKFDWISTSRLTRGFENIRSGYKGWDPQALEKASSFAFVIVSADGKHRTNVIEA